MIGASRRQCICSYSARWHSSDLGKSNGGRRQYWSSRISVETVVNLATYCAVLPSCFAWTREASEHVCRILQVYSSLDSLNSAVEICRNKTLCLDDISPFCFASEQHEDSQQSIDAPKFSDMYGWGTKVFAVQLGPFEARQKFGKFSLASQCLADGSASQFHWSNWRKKPIQK